MQKREFDHQDYKIQQQTGENSFFVSGDGLDNHKLLQLEERITRESRRYTKDRVIKRGLLNRTKARAFIGNNLELHTQEDINLALNYFTENQRGILEEDLNKGDLEPFKSNDPRNIFAAFKGTKSYKDVILLANSELKNIVSDYDYDKFRSCFVGKFYEQLASHIMAAKEYPERIVLPPEDTRKLFIMLHPDGHLIKGPFDTQSIDGVTTPDGLVIEVKEGSPIITRFVESTAVSHDSPKFEKQAKGYNTGIFYLRRTHPYILDKNIIINFVIPSPSGNFEMPSITNYNNVELRVLNFTHRDLRSFVDESIPQKQRNKNIIYQPKPPY